MTRTKMPPNAGKGRKPGPNKLTVDVNTALKILSGPGSRQKRASRCLAWLRQIAEKDPARALEVFLGLVRRTVPRVKRVREVVRSDGA